MKANLNNSTDILPQTHYKYVFEWYKYTHYKYVFERYKIKSECPTKKGEVEDML